jgi:glyoxylase-like metal-dependent hydrolase (beta-lactamase superfamily II)
MLPYLAKPPTWKLLGAMMAGGARPVRIREVRTYVDGETLEVAGHPRVIHTPGHCCLWLEE